MPLLWLLWPWLWLFPLLWRLQPRSQPLSFTIQD